MNVSLLNSLYNSAFLPSCFRRVRGIDAWEQLNKDTLATYPNTDTTDGRAVMQKHLEHNTASLCVKFSDIIHESMIVSTPVGSFKVPDSYGIEKKRARFTIDFFMCTLCTCAHVHKKWTPVV